MFAGHSQVVRYCFFAFLPVSCCTHLVEYILAGVLHFLPETERYKHWRLSYPKVQLAWIDSRQVSYICLIFFLSKMPVVLLPYQRDHNLKFGGQVNDKPAETTLQFAFVPQQKFVNNPNQKKPAYQVA